MGKIIELGQEEATPTERMSEVYLWHRNETAYQLFHNSSSFICLFVENYIGDTEMKQLSNSFTTLFSSVFVKTFE